MGNMFGTFIESLAVTVAIEAAVIFAKWAWPRLDPRVCLSWTFAIRRSARMVRAMGWKQSEIALGDPLMTAVQMAVADAHLLDTARRGSVSSGFALFTRNHDQGTTLLLSPEAAEFISLYPGQWEDCAGPGDLGWGGLYTEARSWELLAVRLESDA